MAFIKEDLNTQILETYVDVMKNSSDAFARLQAAEKLQWIVQSVTERSEYAQAANAIGACNVSSPRTPFSGLIR